MKKCGGLFSRKGFFALNVQVIVDNQKRVLWHSIRCCGGEHDSSAFKITNLHRYFIDIAAELAKNGWFIIGDSAYSIRSFLLTPFENVKHGTAEDNFNFFHSSSRIIVECAFGEIHSRWGIFQRPLQSKLDHNI